MENFLMELEECLRGEVTDAECRESLQYYKEYFKERMNTGLGEEEVIRSLGSPRLIAKSIIDARGNVEEDTSGGGYYDAEEDKYHGEYEERPQIQPKSLSGVKLMLIALAVLLLLGSVIRLFLPIAVILVPVFLIFQLFRRNE